MTRPVGFFQLDGPLDLFAKMKFHLEQLIADPLNEYAAFDFVVAAAHLPEWLSKARCSCKLRSPKAEAMNAVCQQLANGAKHFLTGNHSAVRATTISTPAVAGLAVSGLTVSGGVDPRLLILLSDDEAAALETTAITVTALAAMVVEHWEGHDGLKGAAERQASQGGPGRNGG